MNRHVSTVCSFAAIFAILAQPVFSQDSAAIGSAEWFLDVLPGEAPTDGTTPDAQRYGQLVPAVGRDDLWRSYPHRVILPGSCEIVSGAAGFIHERVSEAAGSTRIVIVNEAHDIPWHRQFTESLLEPLWNQGYRYFAAEAFSESIDDYPDEEFGRIDAGYYASEPTFGRLIRSARQLGFELVPYEAPPPPDAVIRGSISEQVAYREESQANQLIERVLSRDPEAKVLVHVGYSHAAEVPIPSFDNSTMPWMAARLKEKTGIDPLTIDQTYCRSPGDALQLARPTELMPAGTFDLAIAYPEIDVSQGRGTWRLASGFRLVAPPEDSVPTSGRAILEARYADEPDEAIPVDRLILHAGESLPLVLPADSFRLEVLEESTGERKQFALVVEDRR
jgi:hypothetical protein